MQRYVGGISIVTNDTGHETGEEMGEIYISYLDYNVMEYGGLVQGIL